jgi:competence protein ComEC
MRYTSVSNNYKKDVPIGIRRGTIVTNPAQTSYGQSFLFKTTQNEKVLVRYSGNDFLEYGNILTIHLKCSRPKNFETDLGSTFDYARYLKKDHVYSICSASTSIYNGSEYVLQQYMYRFAHILGRQIDILFGTPHSDFIGGILVGDKNSIPNDIRNDFIKTGTIHILALSGYNIAIVALFFQRFFSFFLNKRGALFFAGLSVVLFVAMTGFSASAIRAGIMAVVVIISQWSYQKYNPLRALFFASLLMILYDPFYLVYDTSFHLSFLATFGIIMYTPVFEKLFKKVTSKPLRTAITTTISAYIVTFPYLLFFFKGVSIIGILVNIIVVPIIPLVMLTSSGALLMSTVSVSFAGLASYLSEFTSGVILKTVSVFASIPYGYINASIPVWVCFLLYATIFYWMYDIGKKVDLQKEV